MEEALLLGKHHPSPETLLEQVGSGVIAPSVGPAALWQRPCKKPRSKADARPVLLTGSNEEDSSGSWAMPHSRGSRAGHRAQRPHPTYTQSRGAPPRLTGRHGEEGRLCRPAPWPGKPAGARTQPNPKNKHRGADTRTDTHRSKVTRSTSTLRLHKTSPGTTNHGAAKRRKQKGQRLKGYLTTQTDHVNSDTGPIARIHWTHPSQTRTTSDLGLVQCNALGPSAAPLACSLTTPPAAVPGWGSARRSLTGYICFSEKGQAAHGPLQKESSSPLQPGAAVRGLLLDTPCSGTRRSHLSPALSSAYGGRLQAHMAVVQGGEGRPNVTAELTNPNVRDTQGHNEIQRAQPGARWGLCFAGRGGGREEEEEGGSQEEEEGRKEDRAAELAIRLAAPR
ncbi:uncharacterized protein ACIGJ3_023190 [Trichechus inunguis]